jgi:hypothetical protein
MKCREKVMPGSYRLSLAPYMCIDLVVNVENLKLYKFSMLEQGIDEKNLSTIEDLAP